jgi:hypothetical protein
MIARAFARVLVLLLFVTQGLAPFLHAHAGTTAPSGGVPLHLHLGAPSAIDAGAQWRVDDGKVVTGPPEVRRDSTLVVADLPCAAPNPRIAVVDDGARAPAGQAPTEAITASPPAPSARAPPAPAANRRS